MKRDKYRLGRIAKKMRIQRLSPASMRALRLLFSDGEQAK